MVTIGLDMALGLAVYQTAAMAATRAGEGLLTGVDATAALNDAFQTAIVVQEDPTKIKLALLANSGRLFQPAEKVRRDVERALEMPSEFFTLYAPSSAKHRFADISSGDDQKVAATYWSAGATDEASSAGKRFRTEITLNTSLEVDPLDEEELIRQIMVGDVSHVPVKRGDVVWRIKVHVGELIAHHRRAKNLTLKKMAAHVDGLKPSSLSMMENAGMWGGKYYPGLEKVLGLEPGFFRDQIRAIEPKVIREAKIEKAVEMIAGHELKRLRLEKGWSPEVLLDEVKKFQRDIGCNTFSIEYAERGHYFSKETKKNYRDFARTLGLPAEYFENLVKEHSERLAAAVVRPAPSVLSQIETKVDWTAILQSAEEQIGEPVQAIYPTDTKGVWTVVTKTGKAFRLVIAVSELTKK